MEKEPDGGLLETTARKALAFVELGIERQGFKFGLGAAATGGVIYTVQPMLGLISIALGVGALAAKLGTVIDRRLR